MSKSDINSRSFLVSKFGLQGKGKREKEKDKAKKRAGRLGKLQEDRGSVALPCRVRVLPGCFDSPPLPLARDDLFWFCCFWASDNPWLAFTVNVGFGFFFSFF